MGTRSSYLESKAVRDIHLTMNIKPPGKWIPDALSSGVELAGHAPNY
jgi:hypothetical protein